MSSNFEISIGANIKGLQAALKEATAGLEGFDKSAGLIDGAEKALRRLRETARNATDPAQLAKYNAQIEKLEHSLVDLNKLGRQGSMNPFAGVDRGANAASIAVMNFGRVAQDAAFGPMAIANNLNPLLESFQRLRAETGSNVGALKALGASLVGGGGLGLAFSAITAAMSFAQVGLDMWFRKTKAAKAETDELNKSIGSLASSAATESAKLAVLYDATQNINIPLKQRNKLVDALQEKYPSYFGNLTNEEILAGKAAKSYENLSQAIINSAVARAGEDIIAAQVKKLAELSIHLNVAAGKMKGLTDAQREVMASGAEGFIVDEKGDMETISNYKTKLTDEIKAARTAIQGLLSNFSADIILGDFTGGKDKAKKKEIRFEVIPYTDSIKTSSMMKQIKASMGATIGKDGNVVGFEIPLNPTLDTAPLFSQGEIIKEYFQYDIVPQLQSGFNNFFNEALVHGELSFKSLGESIKNTFASVLANEATQGLLSLLAGGKGSVGKKGGGLFSILGGALGLGAKGGGAAAAGTAASGGALLPILAGGAAIAGLFSLFKGKKKSTSYVPQSIPMSQYAPNVSASSYSSSGINSGGVIRLELDGLKAVALINRAGYQLSRYK